MSKTLICYNSREKTKNAEHILLTFHWVGGNANSFRFISKQLQDFPLLIYGVNLPVRYPGDKSSPLKSMKEVVDYLLENLVSQTAEWNPRSLPITLLGHSCGAIVAFELMSAIQSSPVKNPCFQVQKVIFSASIPPLHLVKRNAQLFLNFHSNENSDVIPSFRKSDNKLIAYIKENDGLPANLPEQFLKDLLPVIRNDYFIYDTYNGVHHEEKLSIPVVALIPTEDKSTSVDINCMEDWKFYTNGEFVCESIEGGSHFYLIKNEFQKEFIEQLRKHLGLFLKV
jgi:surfactin synthase thioesterase subunit